MSEYPSDWRECLLGDVVNKITSGGTPKADNPLFYGGDIPFLKIDDITVNNNRGMGFVPNKLYQECLQRRYEHSDFALEGFRKEEEPIDNTAFKLELPKEEK